MPHWYMTMRNGIMLLHCMIGVMVFGYALAKRRFFLGRVFGGLAVGFVACCMVQRRYYITRFDTMEALLSHAGVTVAMYLILIALVWFCFDETFWTALFTASSGYIAQDIGGSLKQILKRIPILDLVARDNTGIIGLDMLCYGSMFTLLYFAFRPCTCDRNENFNNRIKTLFAAGALLVGIVMARLTQDQPNRTTVSVIAESLYAMLCSVMILALQFSVMNRAKLSNQVETMRELIHQQQMQYEASRENVQLVNEKYHDLKRMLQDMQSAVPAQQLARLQRSVEAYDTHVEVGDPVLDVLLSEKLSVCQQQNITLTCCVKNTDFDFMEELDLYTLLLNALNNAIDAVKELPDDGRRFITLTSSREGDMLTIHMENPCAGQLRFDHGLPQTAHDPHYHGFGMKSMVRTAEKYHGTLAVKQQEGMFFLDVLLLKPKKTFRARWQTQRSA